MRLQRKRPVSTGPSTQRHQPAAKRTKLNLTQPSAAISADNYSQLATSDTAASTHAEKFNISNQRTPRSAQPLSASLLPAPLTTTSPRSVFPVAVTGSRTAAQQNTAGVPSPTVARPTHASPTLAQVHFLLSSAHLTALSAPATSRHLIRVMRHLAAASDIPVAPAVDERYCDACSTVLVPGVNCKLAQRRDEQREERWNSKQRRAKQKRDAASQPRHDQQRVQDEQRAVESRSVLPVTRRQRHQAGQKQESMKRQRQSETDVRAAGVTFTCAVNVCGHCGHENVLAGTQRKRGGMHSSDVRKREGTDGKARPRQKQPSATAPATTAEVQGTADRARQERSEKRKAQHQTEKLRKQQTISGGRPAAVQRPVGAAGNTAPDPFAGSLFLKFQKLVSHHHVTYTTSLAASVLARLGCVC